MLSTLSTDGVEISFLEIDAKVTYFLVEYTTE